MDASRTHRASDQWLRDLRRWAAETTQPHRVPLGRYALGPWSFSLSGCEHERLQVLIGSLLPAISEPNPDELRIDVVHGTTPAGSPPGWNLPHSDVRHLERLHLSADGTLAAQYNEDLSSWLILDQSAHRGLLWIDELEKLPAWDLASPFKTLFHWYLAPSELCILHAGAVASKETATLLVGPGGAGKSTTVAIAASSGISVFGDDLVIVGEHEGLTAVFSLYNAIKLDPAAAIPRSLAIASGAGFKCADKMAYRYADLGPDRLMRSAPLAAIAHSVVTGRPETIVVGMSHPAQLLRALAPSTLFLLRGFEQRTLAKISTLVRALPGFDLQLGADPEGVARALRQIA